MWQRTVLPSLSHCSRCCPSQSNYGGQQLHQSIHLLYSIEQSLYCGGGTNRRATTRAAGKIGACCGLVLEVITNKLIHVQLQVLNIDINRSPWASGQRSAQHVRGPSWVYCPTTVSRRKTGSPHRIAKKQQGIKNTPVHTSRHINASAVQVCQVDV